MIKRNNNQAGFTIIELLIFIIIITILGLLIISSFSDFRQKERNQSRQKDIKALQVAIEGYYAQNGNYPTLDELNDPQWRTKNLKALEDDDYKDPQGTNSKLTANPENKIYSYNVKADDNTDCDNKTKDCQKYTLTGTLEEADPFIKNNVY
ncbi:prepilin-type N-terminal cleavage/methylation domain-containing protein [Candidatus Saccharibacteria bacterium]|nr:prepilin-type N-terminal cleavage/methylation domain-containing protein [Candidatus Saccharibacteria bacterium]